VTKDSGVPDRYLHLHLQVFTSTYSCTYGSVDLHTPTARGTSRPLYPAALDGAGLQRSTAVIHSHRDPQIEIRPQESARQYRR
jgi:hypothetical protein